MDERIKEALVKQFTVKTQKMDDGYTLHTLVFKPEGKVGDGTFYLVFSEDEEGELKLVDYCAE